VAVTMLFAINHENRYAAETMALLFFPGSKFTFCDDFSQVNENEIAAKSIIKDNVAYSEVIVGGNSAVARCEISPYTSAEEKKKNEQAAVKLSFFTAANKLTGIRPPWGVLTGIRPAKVARDMALQGKSNDDIIASLQNDYLLLPDKARLCLETAQAELRLIKESTAKDVSFYISIPFCPTRCRYCSFVSHSIEKAAKLIPDYVELLCKEIESKAKIIKKLGLNVKSVYMGGGTPTTLSAEQLTLILDTVVKNIDLSNICEFTVEAGRPDTITDEKLAAIRSCGADRISINPQTMNDEILKNIGRNHTADDIYRAMDAVKKYNFTAVNMDLIAGLQGDTFESFCNTLSSVEALHPENITVHALSVKRAASDTVEHTAVYDPSMHPAVMMTSHSYEFLHNKGYIPYYMYRQKNTVGNAENVGYSLVGKEGMYNIFIMQELHTIISAGGGGVTKLVSPDRSFIDRVFNLKYPYEYISRFNEIIDSEKAIEDFYSRY